MSYKNPFGHLDECICYQNKIISFILDFKNDEFIIDENFYK